MSKNTFKSTKVTLINDLKARKKQKEHYAIQGWLEKTSPKKWKKRLCKLNTKTSSLEYFVIKGKKNSYEMKGEVPLSSVIAISNHEIPVKGREFVFGLKIRSGRTYYFAAPDINQRDQWYFHIMKMQQSLGEPKKEEKKKAKKTTSPPAPTNPMAYSSTPTAPIMMQPAVAQPVLLGQPRMVAQPMVLGQPRMAIGGQVVGTTAGWG